MVFHSLLAQAAALSTLASLAAGQTSSNTATVNLAVNNGSPQHLASGFIYGLPDGGFGQSPSQIPSSFYSGMGFRYARAGGAQMTQGGWIDGLAAYKARFASTLQNYQTARSLGARFQILPHDIWGTDHANSSTVWPGDNGVWTNYDQFLAQLMSDIVANNMLTGLDWDLWNEPDGSFWARSETQYLAMWNRTYVTLRANKNFASVPIVGPSSAGQPSPSYSWWTTWLQYVVQHNVVPDQYTWHDEPGDVATDITNFNSMLSTYKAPTKPININEYGTFDQQVASGAAWWISRLERYNLLGLRGNWLSGCQLHDFAASLLGKTTTSSCTGTGYFANGEWQVYNYYSHNMTGTRAGTTGTGDGVMDVYATVGSDGYVRVLTGVNDNTGTWYITINNLSSVGLPTSGTLNIQTWGFQDAGHYGSEGYPSNRGVYGHAYSGNSVTFPVYQTSQDEYTAWAFVFAT